MAAREPVEIVIGGQTYAIRPLTINQVEAIEDAMLSSTAPTRNLVMARNVICIALARDYAEACAAVRQGEVETDAPELGTAVNLILRQGGFLPATPGESPAAAENATGGKSAAVSPQRSPKHRPK